MQIEEDTHDEFHRTDLEGGDDGPEEAEAAAAAAMDGASQCDDDYKAEAPAEEESDDEDKQTISKVYFNNTTVQNEKENKWDMPFVRAKFMISSIAMSLWVPIIFLSGMGGLCIYFGTDDKVTLENKYTQYHLKVNKGCFFALAVSIFFGWSMAYLRAMGKFENKVLRMIVEPFLVLFRLAATCAFTYFVLYRLLILDFLVGCLYACTDNWWAKKTDPWVTNASYFNAIINWPVFFMGFVYMFYIVAGVLFVLFQLFTCKSWFMRKLRDLPKNTWLFLRGLDEDQYEFSLDKKCPMCKEGFSSESKMGTIAGCECWFHRKCLVQKIKDDIAREGDKNCEGCGKRTWYPEPDTPEEAQEEAEPAEGPEDAAEAEPAAAAE